MKVNAYHEDKKDGAWANGHQGFQDKSEKKKKQLEIRNKNEVLTKSFIRQVRHF